MLGFFLSSAVSSSATTIIAVRTPDGVVLGADSKMTKGDGAESWTACKIGSANNVLWAISGIVDVNVPTMHFSMIDAAKASLSGTQESIEDRIKRFEAVVVPPLTNLFRDLKRGDPSYFSRDIEGKVPTSILLAGMEDNTAFFHVRSFRVKSDTKSGVVGIEIAAMDCPSSGCLNTGTTYLALGEHADADRQVADNPDLWTNPGIVAAVRSLIQTEIRRLPALVGPPIALVAIMKDGVHWISRGACISP